MNTPLADLAKLTSRIADIATQAHLELAEDNGKRTKYYNPVEGINTASHLAVALFKLNILIADATQNIPSRDSEEGGIDNK